MTQNRTPDKTTDASDLGLRPGDWPTSLGDGFYRRFSTKRDNDGDVVYVRYLGGDGSSMVVFND